MVKIISYVVIVFFYRKANILRRGSNTLQDPMGTKACVTAADLTDSDGNMHAAFEHLLY